MRIEKKLKKHWEVAWIGTKFTREIIKKKKSCWHLNENLSWNEFGKEEMRVVHLGENCGNQSRELS